MKNNVWLACFIYILFISYSLCGDNIKESKDELVLRLQKEKKKLEKTLKKFQESFEKYQNDTMNFTGYQKEMERQLNDKDLEVKKYQQKISEMKNTVSASSSNSNSNSHLKSHPQSHSHIAKTLSINEILEKTSDYHDIFAQLELHTIEEMHLKDEVYQKLKEITASQKKVDDIYKDLKQTYSDKFDAIIKKVEMLEEADRDLKQRLINVEKEREKSGMVRKQLKGDMFMSSTMTIEPNCVNRGSCRICLSDPKCIWCDTSKKCLAGDISGSYDGSCVTTGEYSYSSCQKEEDDAFSFCGNYKTCTSCISNVNCGWCGETNSCVEGTEKIPRGISCKVGYYHKYSEGKCFDHHIFGSRLK